MKKRAKASWTEWFLIDENNRPVGDNPEFYPGWLVCPKCGSPMPYYGAGTCDDYFECKVCQIKILAADLTDDDYHHDLGEAPACCRLCDGPYPDCTTTCVVVNY